MLERFLVLQHAPLRAGGRVLEVGSGGHAISTVPLAFLVAPDGWILALERQRWDQFQNIVRSSGLVDHVRAVAGDALRLPLREDVLDFAVCIHGVRSLGENSSVVRVLREMLRVAPTIAIMETLPVARTEAQRAHLAMYELRQHVFLATTGRRDDLRYRPLAQLVSLVEQAGGSVKDKRTLEIDLPHALAYFPRALVESIPAGNPRESLLSRWDEANALRLRWGEDHPPVGVVIAARSS
jgi:ubiquinone/menaquinone biosynthesis C-methylase UbiE